MSSISVQSLSQEIRDQVRQIVLNACEPIAPFWPMRTMVAQNPLHGLEYLSFDEAVRKGKDLLGGNGYLANDEYRQFYRNGRITQKSFEHAFSRAGPGADGRVPVEIGSRTVAPEEVWQLHLLYGFEALPPPLLEWELSGGGATKEFRRDLPEESRKRIIERYLTECAPGEHPEETYLTNLWESVLAALELSESAAFSQQSEDSHPQTSASISLPPQRTLSDWVDSLTEGGGVEQINNQLIKWVSAFLDEGLAGWDMPGREEGFYQAWRNLAPQDFSARLLGIPDFAQKVHGLPATPEDAILSSLHQLEIPQEQWNGYLSRQLSSLPGWTRYIRWLGEHPAYHAQRKHPIDITQYLAVRLFYEVELIGIRCRREWGIDGTVSALTAYWNDRSEEYHQRIGHGEHSEDPAKLMQCRHAWRLFHLAQFLELSPGEVRALPLTDARILLQWLDHFPADQHGKVWIEAYEDSFREKLLSKIAAHRGTVPESKTRPHAQLAFCIDVRSESFRRHIEAQGPYETFGFAGFFGIPISHLAFDCDQRSSLCPVLLTPNHGVVETPRPGEDEALEKYSSESRWGLLGRHLFHDLKHHPVGSMMVIDALGFFFSLGLVGKTLFQKRFRAMTAAIQNGLTRRVPTRISISTPLDPQSPRIGEVSAEGVADGLAAGFSLSERATFIENGLRAMGLTKNFARLVCLCGHGSETDNNAYYGALDCGACGGRPGDANARVFAAMANEPEVRRILREKGLPIPDDTWFLPGKHNTTTDRVGFYDLEDFPDSHQEDLQALKKDLEAAGAKQALERCHRIPGAPAEISAEQAFAHVEERSCDWANPRPEWGLAGNAAFIIGRRTLTKGLDLGGRAFLHSYDPIADPQGAILEKIMTAPLIVGEWINTGYYFSAVDPWKHGSGSKVLHNVVGGVGMMRGSQSDLQMGFPLQTVNNGDAHFHEPMRLLAIIEQTPDVISAIIQKHEILQQLFHNQWLNLVALDLRKFEFHRYNPNATWEAVHVPESNIN
ncbi:DUF2309 domain-containing protein [Nitrospina watsonii]|uniref:Probable inorganic carbon transporter subunit DabA n=1 Tax=Nitrospina watsonii TaxID=1323948 RepID=A0ABM9HBS7_9BACT|nr:DUF2309 domain-containing protein [Nitrospina watsonii]CAI2717544.1 conserved protein of unknown function [Nitrospina watsonii]